MPLFHRNIGLYHPGELIPAGNWGRVLLGVGAGHNFYGREYVFERVRRDEFSALPSRLEGAFAFEQEDHARGFRGPNELLYEVEPADPESVSHLADMSWVDAYPEAKRFEDAEGLARSYWQGVKRSGLMERITLGGLRVIRRL